MSNFFKDFPKVLYLFGDEKSPVLFQQLNRYSDLIDVARDDIGAYIEYEIRDYERTDTLASRLYGTPDYGWTFFLMNERLRETGWPKSLKQVYDAGVNDFFPHYTCKLNISTADSAAEWSDKYPEGQAVLVGTKTGTVVSKNLDLGEITVSNVDSDLTGAVSLAYANGTNLVSLTNTVYQYDGTHHYVNDSDEWQDYYFTPTVTKVPVTNLEWLINENELSKRIRVIKKQSISEIVGSYKSQIK